MYGREHFLNTDMAYAHGGPFSRQAGGLKEPNLGVVNPLKEECINSDTSSENTSDGLMMAASSKPQTTRPKRRTPAPQRYRNTSHSTAEAESMKRPVMKRARSKVETQALANQLDGLLVLHEAALEVLGKAVQALAEERKMTAEENEAEEHEPAKKLARTSSGSAVQSIIKPTPESSAPMGRTGSTNLKAAVPLERTASGQSSGRRRGRSELHGPCDHCGVKDSPQWRKGPKCKPILCNACGTRFLRTRSLGKQSQIKAAAAAAAAAAATGERHDAPKPIDSTSTVNLTGEASTNSLDAIECAGRRESITSHAQVTCGSPASPAPAGDSPEPKRVEPAFGTAATKACTPSKSVTFKLPEDSAKPGPAASHDELEESHFSVADSIRQGREDEMSTWARQHASQLASTSKGADSSWLGEAARTLMRSASNKTGASRMSQSSSFSGLSVESMQPSFSVASACAAAGLMPLLSQVVPNGAPTHLQAFLRQQAGLPPAAVLGSGSHTMPNDSQGNKAFMEAAQWRLRMVLSQHMKDSQR